MPFDRDIYFTAMRNSLFAPGLSQKQVDGQNAILDTWEDDDELTDLRWLAYMLATTYHETAQTMQPITEYGSESYLKGKSYYPYIGRGFVQLTWEDNYRRATQELELTGSDDLVKYPDRALDQQIASDVMFAGMVEGWFTGKKLIDYFSASVDDPYNARRIINGTDCADQIKGYHKTFLGALQDSWYDEIITPEVPDEDVDIPIVTVTLASDTPVQIRVILGAGVELVE